MAYNGLYKTVAYTSGTTQTSLNMDAMIAPFNATVAVNVGGGATYKLQYSLDPQNVTDANSTWYDSVNIPAGSTASIVTAFVSPVSKIRLVTASITDTVTLQVQQGMSIN